MAWVQRRLLSGGTKYLARTLAVAIVLLYLVFFFGWNQAYSSVSIVAPLSASSLSATWFPPPGGSADRFWHDLFQALEDARPHTDPIHNKQVVETTAWEPGTQERRPDLISLPAADVALLRAAHGSFVSRLPHIARLMPYEAGTTGIVTTAGSGNFGQVVSMLLVLRRSASALPVQVVVDSPTPSIKKLCAGPLGRLNATCIFIDDVWNTAPPPVEPHRYQWKALSMLASSFQTVLFLDADLLPVRNPDLMMQAGLEPLASTGLVTWPDFWESSVSPLFYAIAGGIETPPMNQRASSESGVVILDKGRHGDSLLLATYYNYYGPDVYYPLLSQGAAGEGDKETFLQAAIVLEALEERASRESTWSAWGLLRLRDKTATKGYWDVRTKPVPWGRWNKGEWSFAFMEQMDPTEDFRAAKAQEASAGTNAIEITQQAKTSPVPESKPNRSARRRGEGGSGRREADASLGQVARRDGGGGGTGTGEAKLETEVDVDKFMFFHANGIKLDFTQVVDEESKLHAQDENGTYLRIWGDPAWIIDTKGRDVEKDLWQDTADFWCDTKDHDAVCNKMRQLNTDIFGRRSG